MIPSKSLIIANNSSFVIWPHCCPITDFSTDWVWSMLFCPIVSIYQSIIETSLDFILLTKIYIFVDSFVDSIQRIIGKMLSSYLVRVLMTSWKIQLIHSGWGSFYTNLDDLYDVNQIAFSPWKHVIVFVDIMWVSFVS